MPSAVPNGHPGRIRGRDVPFAARHGWASARVRDAVRGSAVSTWPRRREREATKKRLAPDGSCRLNSRAVWAWAGQGGQGEVRLAGRRGRSKKAANGWLALIQTETRARHEQLQTGPGSHGSRGGLPVSDQPQA